MCECGFIDWTRKKDMTEHQSNLQRIQKKKKRKGKDPLKFEEWKELSTGSTQIRGMGKNLAQKNKLYFGVVLLISQLCCQNKQKTVKTKLFQLWNHFL